MSIDKRSEEILDRAELEAMSLEQLGQLLDDARDPDRIFAILEVMESKQEGPRPECPDPRQAWKDFQRCYQGQTPVWDIDAAGPDSANDHLELVRENPGRTRPSLRRLRIPLIAALLVVILGGLSMASAFGFGIFQAIADWGTETFRFIGPGGSVKGEGAQEDPYEQLRIAVENVTDVPVVPKWAPEGTEFESVKTMENSERKTVVGTFSYNDNEFTIQISVFETIPEAYSGVLEKNDDGKETKHTVHGIEHSIMSNNDRANITWTNENVKAYIQGQLSVEQLKKMVDSIYEE